MTKLTRRSVVVGGASTLMVSAGGPALAQAKQKLRFSSAFTETDLRAEAYKSFAAGDQGRLRLRAVLGQHAFQAGHRAGRAPARQSRSVQSRAGRHFETDSGMVAADLRLPVPRCRAHERRRSRATSAKNSSRWRRISLASRSSRPVYFGSRSVNLKPDKQIKTPRRHGRHQAAHAAQASSGSSSASRSAPIRRPSPTPSSTRALQTGTVDGQDNPLVASKLMKFDEVTDPVRA